MLARAGWQIEQGFRLWKSEALINASASAKPYRALCELYAKLIAVVVQTPPRPWEVWSRCR